MMNHQIFYSLIGEIIILYEAVGEHSRIIVYSDQHLRYHTLFYLHHNL